MTRLTETPQWASGQSVERFLDMFFQHKGWTIERTTPHQERVLCLGDRIYSKGDETYFVEYKSGKQTRHTGNVFLETISVDATNIPGWVYTCQANYIFYAALLNHKILVFVPARLRMRIEMLKTQFRVVKTSNEQNKGYNTHGVIVPLEYAAHYLADKVINISELVSLPE